MIFAVGEKALCEEAENLTPGVVTVPVKRGILKDGLDDLCHEDYGVAKTDAIHKSPNMARELIYNGALSSIEMLKSNRGIFRHVSINPPYKRVVKYRHKRDGSPGYVAVAENARSIVGLLNKVETII